MSSPTKTRDGVAIVGFTDHREQVLQLDTQVFELFGLNELYRYMPVEKFSRWFELHPRSEVDKDKDHLEALKKFPIPVYMQEKYPDIPSSVRFPKEEVERDLPRMSYMGLGEYKTSSPAWMLGLALKERFKKIHMYGVDMAQDTEYQEQRNCCEFLLGVAAGRKIEIYLPPTSDLLKAIGQYGYGLEGALFQQKLAERIKFLDNERDGVLKGIKQLESQKAGLLVQYGEKRGDAERNLRHVEGSILDCQYWQRSWAPAGDGGSTAFLPDRSKDPATGIKADGASG